MIFCGSQKKKWAGVSGARRAAGGGTFTIEMGGKGPDTSCTGVLGWRPVVTFWNGPNIYIE